MHTTCFVSFVAQEMKPPKDPIPKKKSQSLHWFIKKKKKKKGWRSGHKDLFQDISIIKWHTA